MEKQKFSARVKQAMGEASITNLYQLNGMVPVHKAIPFGLQHILAMFVANIAPILIVGGACGLAASDMAMLIQSAMLIAGIGTLVQLFPIFHKIGSGLPIVMGISFTFVSIMCYIGANYGYGTIMGAVLIGGLIAWFVSTRSKDQALNKARMSQGTLIASGFIAGGALMGVVGAILKFADVDWKLTQWNSSNAASWVGLGMYLALIIYFAVHSLRAKKEE